jgi:PAS domain S-box-containing protein
VEEKLGLTLGQVVGLPLLFEDELLGIIYLFRSEYAFTQMDWQFLQGFADQAAIAVRNARLYHQLETERTRLATIIENSADGIMILDMDRRVVVINQALAAMVGLAEEEAVGRPCAEVLPLEKVTGEDLCQAETVDDFMEGASRRCEGELIRPGGSRIIVSATYTPLYDEAEHLVNLIVNVHDITRFREEEEMKSTFTSIISHELKTPVALIKGYAQTLARPDATWDAATARQSLEIIEEEADRLEALINNLLDVSRIQASGLRLDYADVDMEGMARKVAEAYRTQTTLHRLEVDFPERLPLIWGDEERLRQVLTNLLGNAIKYSPEGGVIRIGGWTQYSTGEKGPARVILFVADQGIGIPQDELPHIFDRFYRVDSSLRRSTMGAGLGLFLTKAIVEAHGGQIWARSEPGKGTTFFVALPVEHGAESPASTTL